MIDNDYYNREAQSWWSEKEGPLAIIRYTMNPVRFAYVMKHLVHLSYDYRGKTVLDVGCGGGFLTEEIAKFGLKTTGLDPSAPTLREARKHAAAMDLQIDYQEGFGEALPFPDNHFDMVFCLDVLEHVRDFRLIIQEVQRVLKPGGFFFFETVNKTLLSWFVVIFLFQKFPLTRLIPRDVHKWKYFIRPRDLARSLKERGFKVEDMQGILPGYNFTYNIFLIRKMVANKISFHELCSRFRCHESAYKGLCYLGFGTKK